MKWISLCLKLKLWDCRWCVLLGGEGGKTLAPAGEVVKAMSRAGASASASASASLKKDEAVGRREEVWC